MQVVFKEGTIIYLGNSPDNAAESFKNKGGDDISTITSLPQLVNLFLEKNKIDEPKMEDSPTNWLNEIFNEMNVSEAEKVFSDFGEKFAQSGRDAVGFTKKTTRTVLKNFSSMLKTVSNGIDKQVEETPEEG